MKLFDLIERVFHFAVDGLFAGLPQSKPGKAALGRCRIVSHRGEHDNIAVFENTLTAFDRARDSGVWGIECDIRWTKDLVPVVFHDADLQRLFGDSLNIGQTILHKLRKEYPQIPTLAEVLTRYGKNMHLMVEIKAETYPDPAYQDAVSRFGRWTDPRDRWNRTSHAKTSRGLRRRPLPLCGKNPPGWAV